MLVGCDVTKEADLDTQTITFELERVWTLQGGWSSVPQWQSDDWRVSRRLHGFWVRDTLFQRVRTSKALLTLDPNGGFHARMYMEYAGADRYGWTSVRDTFDVHGPYYTHGTFLDFHVADGSNFYAEWSDESLFMFDPRRFDLGERAVYRGPPATLTAKPTVLSGEYRMVEFFGFPVPMRFYTHSWASTLICEGTLSFSGNQFTSTLTRGQTCDSAITETATGTYLFQGPLIRFNNLDGTDMWLRVEEGDDLAEIYIHSIGPWPRYGRRFVRVD